MDGLTISGAQKWIDANQRVGESSSAQFQSPKSISPSTDNKDGSFAATLKDAIGTVNQMQKESDVQMQKLATGQSDNIHDVMIAAEKADIALKLMVQIRNKMIEAYQEVMKMQV